MPATLAFNPLPTTNALGSFNITAEGYVQGCAMDNPAARNFLAGGVLAQTETLPMWGGVGISEAVPTEVISATNPLVQLGSIITRATNATANAAGSLTGFSVFDQAHNFINTPQSPVPLAGSGMSVHFYRFGSGARIPLAMDPVLISARGGIVTQQLSWDFALQRLIPFNAGYAANVLTALTRALVSGVYVATATTTSAHGVAVGADFTIAGETPSAYNGTWTAIAGTTGSTLVYSTGLTVDPGASTVQGTLVAGGGQAGINLEMMIIDVQLGNSMVVSRDPVTGFVTWNRSGSCALVTI